MQRTELIDQIIQSPMAQQFLRQVSPIYGEAYTALWMYEVIGQAVDIANERAESFKLQTAPQTATWTLDLWEKEYGIIPDPSWTTAQRQKNLVASRAVKTRINPEKIKNIVAGITGLDVEVRENAGKNKFTIKINGYTNNVIRAMEAVEAAKPAHLLCAIVSSEVLQSMANEYYGIMPTMQEKTIISVQSESDDYIRVANERGEVLYTEDGTVYVLNGEQVMLVDPEGNELVDNDGNYLYYIN